MAKSTNANFDGVWQWAGADGDAPDRTDVSGPAAGLDTHDHSSGKGLPAVRVGTAANPATLSGTPAAGALLIATSASAAAWNGQAPVLNTAAPSTPTADAVYKESTVKAYARVDISGGTPSLVGDFNINGITDNGAGDITVTWETDFVNVNYAVAGIVQAGAFAHIEASGGAASWAVGSARINLRTDAGATSDTNFAVIAVGQQS